MVDLLEILHSFLTDGITWSTVIAVYLAWHKIREGKQKRVAHERMEQKQQAIMSHLGVPWDWDAEKKSSKPSTGKTLLRYSPAAKSLVRTVWLFIHRKVIDLLTLRRVRRMNGQINWITLIPAVVGAIKLILQPFGIDLAEVTDQHVNDIANGVAALATIIGIFASHRKGDSNGAGSAAKYTGDGPAI